MNDLQRLSHYANQLERIERELQRHPIEVKEPMLCNHLLRAIERMGSARVLLEHLTSHLQEAQP